MTLKVKDPASENKHAIADMEDFGSRTRDLKILLAVLRYLDGLRLRKVLN